MVDGLLPAMRARDNPPQIPSSLRLPKVARYISNSSDLSFFSIVPLHPSLFTYQQNVHLLGIGCPSPAEPHRASTKLVESLHYASRLFPPLPDSLVLHFFPPPPLIDSKMIHLLTSRIEVPGYDGFQAFRREVGIIECTPDRFGVSRPLSSPEVLGVLLPRSPRASTHFCGISPLRVSIIPSCWSRICPYSLPLIL